MQYTRKQIIADLKRHAAATVPELSQRLNLTITTIRHHIKELEEQKVVQEIGKIPADGRGRPTKQYGLTVEAQDHNLDDLSAALLQILIQSEPKEEQVRRERRFAIADQMIGGIQHHPNPVQRLNQGIAWLNQHNYRARWEAAAAGPRVIIEHCPYRAIQEQTPAICQLDLALVSRLIGVEEVQIHPHQGKVPGSHPCIFDITPGFH